MTPPTFAGGRPPRRVLIVSLDQMGDLVFASALVAPLREHLPGVEVDIWCREYFVDVARLIPGVNRIFSVRPFWIPTAGFARGRIRDLVASVRVIHRARHDAAVLAAAPWRTAAAVALARIPVRIGHARRRNRFFLTHQLEGAAIDQPVVAEEARLLAPLGIHVAALTTRLDRTAIAADASTLRTRLGRPFVALHAFAVDRARCLPVSEWLVVAKWLADQGFAIVWIGSHAELREIPADAPGFRADALTDGSIGATTTILAAAALFAGHDSGPLHVANALGVPAVAVFTPGEPGRTFPQGQGEWRMLTGASPRDVGAGDVCDAIATLTHR